MTAQNLELTKWASAIFGETIGNNVRLLVNLSEGNKTIVEVITPDNHTL